MISPKQFTIFFLALSLLTHPIEARSRNKKNEISNPSKDPLSLDLPKGWKCINDANQLPEKVKKIYIGTGKGKFTPSINIATEETTKSIEDYLQAAKTYHEAQGRAKCQLLGTLKTQSGVAHLLQIDRVTEWGEVRFLQAALIQEGQAYVITATSLQEEFNSYYTQFFQAIQSFTIQ